MIAPTHRHSQSLDSNTLHVPNDYNPYTAAKHRRSQSNQTGFMSLTLDDLDLIPEHHSIHPPKAPSVANSPRASPYSPRSVPSLPRVAQHSRNPSRSKDYTFSTRTSRKADHEVKLVVVGDGGCGKTCLLVSYTQNKFPEIYVPTIFETYLAQMLSPDGTKQIALSLWDTAGQEEYDRLRPLSYPDVDVVLACFALDNPTSLQNIRDAWMPELNHFCPGVPVILVGTKSDLTTQQVTNDEIVAVAQVVKVVGFVKCSAKTMVNVRLVFNLALDCVMLSRQSQPAEATNRWSKRLSRNFEAEPKGHHRSQSNPMNEPTQEYHKNSEYFITSDLKPPQQRKSRKCTIL